MEPRQLKSVMIVDDDADLIAVLAEALTDRGLVVQAFTEAGPALARLSAAPLPDVLLLDYLLSDINAAQFARILARDHIRVPIVLLTGADRVCGDALHHVPAARVLKKPFDLDELFGALQAVVAGEPVGTSRTSRSSRTANTPVPGSI